MRVALPPSLLDVIFCILFCVVSGLSQSELRPEHVVAGLVDGVGDANPAALAPAAMTRVVVSVTPTGTFVENEPVTG